MNKNGKYLFLNPVEVIKGSLETTLDEIHMDNNCKITKVILKYSNNDTEFKVKVYGK